ncbi:MAG: hypothetical protein M3436_20535 [Pseudomonadota bacterium]|nr:hypothetical protein [Pseudomonadota bacterium]
MNEGGQHEQNTQSNPDPGYAYGTSAVAKSPLSEQDFDLQALWRLILKEYCPRPA